MCLPLIVDIFKRGDIVEKIGPVRTQAESLSLARLATLFETESEHSCNVAKSLSAQGNYNRKYNMAKCYRSPSFSLPIKFD